MTSFEILKQADRIVAGLIREKTPPVFETCRKAYADLGELVAFASRMMDDGVPPAFAAGVDDVVQRLDVFRAGHIGKNGDAKEMDAKGFTLYFKEQVEKALAEPTSRSLQRLYALRSAITKATSYFTNEGASISIEMYTDPFQQATAEKEGGGSAKITSGNAQAGEVTATPGISIEQVRAWEPQDVMKSVIQSVAKAEAEEKDIDFGWSTDLTSSEFLRGERPVDFGKDFTK